MKEKNAKKEKKMSKEFTKSHVINMLEKLETKETEVFVVEEEIKNNENKLLDLKQIVLKYKDIVLNKSKIIEVDGKLVNVIDFSLMHSLLFELVNVFNLDIDLIKGLNKCNQINYKNSKFNTLMHV